MPPDRELRFQADRAQALAVAPTPERIFRRYRELRHWRLYPREFLYHPLGDLQGKGVLDFGCGEGEVSVQLARFGARVTGMDISPELIAIARQRACLYAVEVDYVAGDILQCSPGEFDIVVANAVLHHVDVRATVPRLLACLRPGGLLVADEAIGLSPLLQRLRKALTISSHASPDEHPLTREEVGFLMASFRSSECRYFKLLGRVVQRFFPGGWPLLWALRADRVLLARCPPLSRFCSTIVVVGRT